MTKEVRLTGEYTKKENGSTSIDFYDETFVIDKVESKSEALSIIKNCMLNERLKNNKKYIGYRKFRTYEVAEYKDTDKKAETGKLTEMTKEAVELGCLPSNLDMYSSSENKEKILEKSIEATKKRRAKNIKANDSLVDLD